MTNYIKHIRSKIGHEKFIQPAARIIVENEKGQVLMFRRVDNGSWGIPAGSLEENETIKACIIREVYEETGIQIIDCQVIGISSNPKNETVTYPNGDVIQYFTIEFYSNNWTGSIHPIDASEVKSASFEEIGMLQQLPKNEQHTFESLAYFRKHQQIKLS